MGVRADLLALPDALLRQGEIASAALVSMDFATGMRRWWTGFGDLEVGGHLWQGTGEVISISEIPATFDLTAEAVTFELAATPEMVALVVAHEAAVRGREVIVYDQLFGPDLQPLLPAWVAWRGTMQELTFAAEGADSQTLRLTCETPLVRRNAPPRGRLTDIDQRARHPGDRGCERMALYKDYTPIWE